MPDKKFSVYIKAEGGAVMRQEFAAVGQAAVQAFAAVDTGQSSAARSADVFSAALAREDAAFAALRASVDPTYAAIKRYETAVEATQRAVFAGSATQTQANQVLALAKIRYMGVADAAQLSGTGMARLIDIGGSGRFVLQNTAAQLGDIAVQLEMGTSPARVMGQQLPQLFGGFGALGGTLGTVLPLIGLVAAVGIPLGAMFFNLGKDVDSAGDRLQTFADKLNAAESALGRADSALIAAGNGGLEELRKKYGAVNAEVQDLLDRLAQIEVRAAQVDVGAVLDSALGDGFQAQIEQLFGTVGTALVSGTTEQADYLREQIRDLQAEITTFEASNQLVPTALRDLMVDLNNELAATEGRFADIGALAAEVTFDPAMLQQISDLQDGLDAAVAAGNFSQVADQLSQMQGLLAATGQELDQGVLDGLTQAEDMARQMAARLGQAAAAADGVSNSAAGITFDTAEAGALAVANNLLAALSFAQQLAQTTPPPNVGGTGGLTFGVGPTQFGDVGDAPLGFGNLASGGRPRAIDLSPLQITGSSGGGGGAGRGGGAAGSNRDFLDSQREAERIFESTRTELEKYNAEVSHADELLDSGALSMDTYNRYIDQLRENLKDPVGEEFRKQIQGLSEDIAGAIVHAASFQDALDAIGDVFASNVQKMAQDLLSSGLNDLMSQVFGGITGGGDFWSSLFGGGALGTKSGPVMGGGVKSFAGGGYTGTGSRSGGTDGMGGFPAMLHPDEFVVDMKRSAGQSSRQGNVYNIDARGAQVGVEEKIIAALRGYDNMMPARVKGIIADPRAD